MRLPRIYAVTALIVAAAWIPLLAQQASPTSPPGTGAISGVVTDGVEGSPVADALVALTFQRSGAAGVSRQTHVTDTKGRFVFTNLGPGDSYELVASAAGFAQGAYGRTSPDSRISLPISLSTGQWMANVKVPIWRYGSISGQVSNERGEPLVGVLVGTALRIRAAGLVHLAAGPFVSTDDRGRYRISGLPTGSYFVYVPNVQRSIPSTIAAATLVRPEPVTNPAAGSPVPVPPAVPMIDLTETTRVMVGGYPIAPRAADGKPLAYPITFAGGAMTIDQAQPIEVSPGSARAGYDIRLLPVPATIIRGVMESTVDAKADLTVRLLAPGLEQLGLRSDVATALVGTDGTFVFGPVPVGSYSIDAATSIGQFMVTTGAFFDSGPTSSPGLVAARGVVYGRSTPPGTSYSMITFQSGSSALVPVTADFVPGPPVTVRLQPSPIIRGEIRLEIDPNHPFVPEVEKFIGVDEANGEPRFIERVPVGIERMSAAPDEFAFRTIPGAYFLRSTSASLTIKSVMYGGRDYAHQALDVPAGAELSGIVVTVTNAAPKLSGTVRDRNGAPTTAAVIAFPGEQAQWTRYGAMPARIRAVLSIKAGRYELAQLPAGDYFVIAVPLDQAEAWRDPEFLLRAAGQAARVSLGWGETRVQDLVRVEIR